MAIFQGDYKQNFRCCNHIRKCEHQSLHDNQQFRHERAYEVNIDICSRIQRQTNSNSCGASSSSSSSPSPSPRPPPSKPRGLRKVRLLMFRMERSRLRIIASSRNLDLSSFGMCVSHCIFTGVGSAAVRIRLVVGDRLLRRRRRGAEAEGEVLPV